MISSLVIVGGLAAIAAGSPTPETAFSFSQWAKDIAEYPEREHLSISEAMDAFQSTNGSITGEKYIIKQNPTSFGSIQRLTYLFVLANSASVSEVKRCISLSLQ